MKNEKLMRETLLSYERELKEKGYNVIYMGLYGSQNYDLADEGSDVDARAVVMPTLKEVVMGTSISKTVEVSNGLVDVKDLVSFLKVLEKGNIAYIESAVTSVYIGEEKVRELLQGYKVKPMSIYGMMMEKLKAIEKGLPASSEVVAKLGYDPKQYHHIVRLMDLIEDALETGELNPCKVCVGEFREELMRIKRMREPEEGNSVQEVVKAATELCQLARVRVDELPAFEVKEFPEEAYEYLTEKLKEML